MSAPCPTSLTKRSRRTKAEVEAIREGFYEIIQHDNPMTVRQVFYQAVVTGLIEKTEAEYQNTVSRLLVEMRRSGVLPYSWIADNTRWVRRPRTYASARAFVEEALAGYRRALWAEQAWHCEVWCEKEALAGVMVDVTADLDAPLLVSRGFSSDSYLYEAADNLTGHWANEGKFCLVNIFTDHDPSGLWIAQTIERRLHEISRDLMGDGDSGWLKVRRVAVTEDQIELWQLPTRPTKRERNSHARDWGDRPSVELDAIPATLLRALVRESIEEVLPPDALEAHLEQEQRDREVLDIVRRAAAEAAP